MKSWKVLSSTTLLERRWLTIREERIELPHGGQIDEFHVIEAPDWTAVLALTEDEDVVMVEQYRHGAGRTSCELPAGVIDPGESALEAARRELAEETGYVAKHWTPISVVFTEPSRHTNRAHFFFASGATRSMNTKFDPSENIRLRLMKTAELFRALDAGEVVHGLHVGAILKAVRLGFLD